MVIQPGTPSLFEINIIVLRLAATLIFVNELALTRDSSILMNV